MRTRYLGPGWDLAKVRGTRFNTGDGIRMALDIGAMPSGNWSGAHAVGWDRNAPEFGDLAVGDNFQKHSYPFGDHGQCQWRALRRRGRGLPQLHLCQVRPRRCWSSPGQFAWQVFDAKVMPLLRDEYRIRQVTKVRADTLEELAGKLDDVDARRLPASDQGLQQGGEDRHAVRSQCQGRARHARLDDARSPTGPTPSTTRRSRPMRSTCGVTFTFGGLRIDTEARVLDTDGLADPRPLRRGRAGGRPVLLQLSGRYRPDDRLGVRPHRRHQRRGARVANITTATSLKTVSAATAGLPLSSRRPAATRDGFKRGRRYRQFLSVDRSIGGGRRLLSLTAATALCLAMTVMSGLFG